jgi:hypothetical protein
VTAKRICSFIEKDRKNDKLFKKLWPAEHDGSFGMWIKSWKYEVKRSYAFPMAPKGFQYKIMRV